MATGTNIRTYFNGTWHNGDVPIMKAADHGAWLGTTVLMVRGISKAFIPIWNRIAPV